jgi:hypothetical protein
VTKSYSAMVLPDIGRVFSRWTVLGRTEDAKSMVCRCACGTTARVRTYSLLNGLSRQCSKCARRQLARYYDAPMHG